MNPNVVEVRIWGQQVGAVAFDDRTNSYAFSYAPSWMRAAVELSPLHMPLAGGRGPFVFPGLPRLNSSAAWRLTSWRGIATTTLRTSASS